MRMKTHERFKVGDRVLDKLDQRRWGYVGDWPAWRVEEMTAPTSKKRNSSGKGQRRRQTNLGPNWEEQGAWPDDYVAVSAGRGIAIWRVSSSGRHTHVADVANWSEAIKAVEMDTRSIGTQDALLWEEDFEGSGQLYEVSRIYKGHYAGSGSPSKEREKKMGKKRNNPRTPIDNMAWHHDQLVRDIAGELDDRDEDEIAESIMELVMGSEEEYEGEGEDDWVEPGRSLEEPRATDRMTKDEAVEASTLASQIVDWANYAIAYGDYSGPPWEEYEENPYERHLREVAEESGYDWPVPSRERKIRHKGHSIEIWYDEASASPYAWKAWSRGIGPLGSATSEEEIIESAKAALDRKLKTAKPLANPKTPSRRKARAQAEYNNGRLSKKNLMQIDRKADKALRECGAKGRRNNPTSTASDLVRKLKF